MNKLSNAFLRVSLFILILAVVGVERAWSVPLEFDPMAGLEQHDPSGVSAARNRTFEIGAAVRARSKPVVAALSRALPRGGVSHHLAISGSPHATVRGAIADSLTPLPIRKNVRGAFDPTSLAVDVAFPVASSVAQQAISKGRVDPRRVVDDVKPVSLAGGLAGGLAGSAAGAALQSTLAATAGPLGRVAGFVARPVMAWAGASVGGRYAARTARGD
ncbi:MAG: hypothetical protein HY816_09705, partial [Candidatus Wallbacteria bacterium]|nr:hypothetical protein [Candidatus Wallbacteria bacterium]